MRLDALIADKSRHWQLDPGADDQAIRALQGRTGWFAFATSAGGELITFDFAFETSECSVIMAPSIGAGKTHCRLRGPVLIFSNIWESAREKSMTTNHNRVLPVGRGAGRHV